MNNEYVIINRTKIEERIKQIDEYEGTVFSEELKQILSKSTPLIPEIEKSIHFCWFETKKELPHLVNIQSDYISNLKLDI